MCGHVSIYYKTAKSQLDRERAIENANKEIYHRGPDDVGYYHNEKVSFGFRRLSIIDIESGHQPFEKQDKVMIFNGEIYNHEEIRKELEELGHTFTTNSDTEVLLTSYIEMKEKCVNKLRGMYAFLIWDEEKQCVFGARDIFGIKPLYYTETEEFIAFASEYKSLVGLLDERKVDKESLQQYLSFQSTNNESTMINDIKKILPGHCFTIKDNKMTIEKYYDIDYKPNGKVTKEDIYNTLLNSVEKHLISDVEVGTFLSGGIDSSILATLASKINPKIKSFSVGFGIDGYNEVDVAKKTADALGIENIQVRVSQDDYINALPEVVKLLDDPLADPSALGIYFLSKEARKHVKVVLSGEGADELFGGYNIYKEFYSVKPLLNIPNALNGMVNKIAKMMPEVSGKSYLLRSTTPLRDRYIGNAKIFENDEVRNVVKNYNENFIYQNATKAIYDEAEKRGYDYVTTMQYVDMNTWLPGDILQKGDKMSMGASIELRVPFLDKEVLELSSQLTLEQKVTKEQSKVLLREAFEHVVPEHVVQKRKLGFPTPIRVWLKEDLGHVVRKTIMDAKVDSFINKEYAIKLLDDHIAGKKDNSRKVWTIFMFSLWHQIFVEQLEISFDSKEYRKAV